MRFRARASLLTSIGMAAACFFAAPLVGSRPPQKPDPSPSVSSSEASHDPLLQAMREELARSKARLKIENVPAPYYIEYRLSDIVEYDAEAAFGALRQDQNFRARSVRVVVRVGDYKQDSYYGPGAGAAAFAPLDNDPVALR